MELTQFRENNKLYGFHGHKKAQYVSFDLERER